MKKNLFVKTILIAIVLLTAVSCDNETLEGEFVDDICSFRIASETELRADIEGSDFRTEIDPESEFVQNNSAVFVIHENANHLTLSGFNSDELGFFLLNLNNPTAGTTYELLTDDETGLPDNNDNRPENPDDFYNPYVTYIPTGGFGVAELTEFNLVEQYASGTFSFTAKRFKRDLFTNEIVLDASGNEIIEELVVNCGNFNRVPFTISDATEGTTGFSTNEFFAKVDEVDFEPISITAQRQFLGDDVVINIRALNDVGDLLRIDIPETLTEGTYDMLSLSDGSQLIGMYNPTMTASENLTSNPGTITITDINIFTGDIEATFSFTGTDPLGIDPAVVQVTEGSFSIDYLPNTNFNNIIIAEVNGEPYFSNYTEVNTSIFNNITRINYHSEDNETNKSISLILPSTITIGTYEISTTLITGEEVLALYSNEQGVSSTLLANSGTLIINEHNEDTGLVEGEFEYTTMDTTVDPPVEYIISSGEFSLFLQ